MADLHFDMNGPTDNKEILAERARMWDAFTQATKYSVIAVVVLLVGIYMLWG